MSRLVVISNRVADPRRAAAGGLAVAMGDALRQTGGYPAAQPNSME